MTIFGIAAGSDDVVIWADTLITSSSAPASQASKLAINPLARVIGVGAGYKTLGDAADAVVLRHQDLDTIVSKVAPALRSAAIKFVERITDEDENWFFGQCYAVVGWSQAEDRFVAYEFNPGDMFYPRRVTTFLCPRVPIDFAGGLLQPAVLHRVASEQAAILRRCGSEVGRLTVATMNRHCMLVLPPAEIAAMPVPDADAPASTIAAGSTAVPLHPGTGACQDEARAPRPMTFMEAA